MHLLELFFELAQVEVFDLRNLGIVHVHCAHHETEKDERNE